MKSGFKAVCFECGGQASLRWGFAWKCDTCGLGWEVKEPHDDRPYRMAYRKDGGRWGEIPSGTMMVWQERKG